MERLSSMAKSSSRTRLKPQSASRPRSSTTKSKAMTSAAPMKFQPLNPRSQRDQETAIIANRILELIPSQIPAEELPLWLLRRLYPELDLSPKSYLLATENHP